MDQEGRPMLGSRRTAWAVAVVAVLAIAAGVALVVVRLGGDSLDPGFVADGTSGTAMAHEAEVQLPIGTVRLASGAPLDEIAARRVGRDGDGSVRAAGDAAIVPVSWSFRPSLSYDDLLGYPAVFSLALVAGGERTELGEQDVDLHETGESGVFPEGSLIAVVAGDGDDLGIEVTYEDQTQTAVMASGKVDPGRAAALYPDGPVSYGPRERCDARRTPEARSIDAGAGSIYCRIDPLTRTPYLPELGWAEEGRVWSTVGVVVTAPEQVRWIPTGGSYRVERQPATVALEGDEAVRTPKAPEGAATTWQGTWVFDSPAEPAALLLHVATPMTAVREPGATGGPSAVPFGVDATFTFHR
ncbi:hypothetical protein RB608_02875 [Nocardioides sp. LHD-245]|uniref:hypothetical protein n=1 Tax=Nocardioides sp. LHD-245 TaxID=3051387 RepID=UPI0027E12267|nr:hypothetical protein [Nocardioides sp. LHD-245]